MFGLVEYLNLILFLPEDESDGMYGDVQSLLMLIHLLQQFLALHLQVLFLLLPLLVVKLVNTSSPLEFLLHAVHLRGQFSDTCLYGFFCIVEVGFQLIEVG